MRPGLLVYKALNRLCRADITRVLLLSCPAAVSEHDSAGVICKWLAAEDLVAVANDPAFSLSVTFIDDFEQYGFLGVSATVDRTIAGVLFLVPECIAARHNSAGPPFKGIRPDLPRGVYYLFKVAVKPEQRGKRINAAMIGFAVEHLKTQTFRAIVTTTDVTNHSFIKSVERIGFKHCRIAAELVFSGRHFYLLPQVRLPRSPSLLEPTIDSSPSDSLAGGVIRLSRD